MIGIVRAEEMQDLKLDKKETKTEENEKIKKNRI